jgi:signal transduction histidine kinase
MSQKLTSRDSSDQRGKLRIGNDWNAITIIALSQSNPLKAIAELVENSIDAHATNVTIICGRSEGRHYLEVRDNGQGIHAMRMAGRTFAMSPHISATP